MRQLASLMPKDRVEAQLKARTPGHKTPLELIVARLRRLESRIKQITIICDEHIDRFGGEPSDITRIKQIAEGAYDR